MCCGSRGELICAENSAYQMNIDMTPYDLYMPLTIPVWASPLLSECGFVECDEGNSPPRSCTSIFAGPDDILIPKSDHVEDLAFSRSKQGQMIMRRSAFAIRFRS